MDLRVLAGVWLISMSFMYCGARSFVALYIVKSILKSIPAWTGSQWRDLRMGEMCSNFFGLVRILAAEFWIGCS